MNRSPSRRLSECQSHTWTASVNGQRHPLRTARAQNRCGKMIKLSGMPAHIPQANILRCDRDHNLGNAHANLMLALHSREDCNASKEPPLKWPAYYSGEYHASGCHHRTDWSSGGLRRWLHRTHRSRWRHDVRWVSTHAGRQESGIAIGVASGEYRRSGRKRHHRSRYADRSAPEREQARRSLNRLALSNKLVERDARHLAKPRGQGKRWRPAVVDDLANSCRRAVNLLGKVALSDLLARLLLRFQPSLKWVNLHGNGVTTTKF